MMNKKQLFFVSILSAIHCYEMSGGPEKKRPQKLSYADRQARLSRDEIIRRKLRKKETDHARHEKFIKPSLSADAKKAKYQKYIARLNRLPEEERKKIAHKKKEADSLRYYKNKEAKNVAFLALSKQAQTDFLESLQARRNKQNEDRRESYAQRKKETVAAILITLYRPNNLAKRPKSKKNKDPEVFI